MSFGSRSSKDSSGKHQEVCLLVPYSTFGGWGEGETERETDTEIDTKQYTDDRKRRHTLTQMLNSTLKEKTDTEIDTKQYTDDRKRRQTLTQMLNSTLKEKTDTKLPRKSVQQKK